MPNIQNNDASNVTIIQQLDIYSIVFVSCGEENIQQNEIDKRNLINQFRWFNIVCIEIIKAHQMSITFCFVFLFLIFKWIFVGPTPSVEPFAIVLIFTFYYKKKYNRMTLMLIMQTVIHRWKFIDILFNSTFTRPIESTNNQQKKICLTTIKFTWKYFGF